MATRKPKATALAPTAPSMVVPIDLIRHGSVRAALSEMPDIVAGLKKADSALRSVLYLLRADQAPSADLGGQSSENSIRDLVGCFASAKSGVNEAIVAIGKSVDRVVPLLGMMASTEDLRAIQKALSLSDRHETCTHPRQRSLELGDNKAR